jgi:hypothetical protein
MSQSGSDLTSQFQRICRLHQVSIIIGVFEEMPKRKPRAMRMRRPGCSSYHRASPTDARCHQAGKSLRLDVPESIDGALDLNNLAGRIIKPVLKANGLTWKGWHGYRRGLATNLHELGVPDKVIQAIMRHET